MKKIKNTAFKMLEKIQSFLSPFGINRKTPGALTVYNFFYRLFWPYENIIIIQGSKIYINPKEESYSMRKTLEAYANNLIHEKATTDLFEKAVKNGDVIIDLGANIGYFSLLAAKLVGENGRVYSFEPEPKNFSYLKKNIEINNYNWVEPFQKAVSDKNGKTKLFICEYETGHHTINQNEGIKAYRPQAKVNPDNFVEVETVALDDFFKDKGFRIDVIKMDVEGAELLALGGMDKILRANQNIKLFVEFFPLLMEKMGSSPHEFIRKFLKDYGFSIFVIPDDYNAMSGKMKEIKSVEEIIDFRKETADHINLFIYKK
jgi:FkbM family methyltransferase